jgi:hypothetical protein
VLVTSIFGLSSLSLYKLILVGTIDIIDLNRDGTVWHISADIRAVDNFSLVRTLMKNSTSGCATAYTLDTKLFQTALILSLAAQFLV